MQASCSGLNPRNSTPSALLGSYFQEPDIERWEGPCGDAFVGLLWGVHEGLGADEQQGGVGKAGSAKGEKGGQEKAW